MKARLFTAFICVITAALFFVPRVNLPVFAETSTMTLEEYEAQNPIEIEIDGVVSEYGGESSYSCPEYDFLLNDAIIGIKAKIPDYLPEKYEVELELDSTDYSVAEPVRVIIGEGESWAVKLKSVGVAKINYNGSISYENISETGDELIGYESLYGSFLVNVAEGGVTKIAVITNGENKVGETVTYKAVLNDNEKLTDYQRKDVKWYKNGTLVSVGSSYTVTLERKTDITVGYKNINPAVQESQEGEIVEITVSVETPSPNLDTINDLWWLWQLLLLGILIACTFILYKVKHISSLEKAQSLFKVAIEKLENIKYDENSKIKRKALRVRINDAETYFAMAKRSCQSAVAEDELYELNSAIASIDNVTGKLNAIKRNVDRIDLTKLNAVMLKLKESVMPSYKVIITAIESAIEKENAAKAERLKSVEEEKAEKRKEIKNKMDKIKGRVIKNDAEVKDILDDKDNGEIRASETALAEKTDDTDDVIGAIIIGKNIDDANNGSKK